MTHLTRFVMAMRRLFDPLAEGLVGLAALMLFTMALLINTEVLGRYIFGFSTLISDEYSGYLFTGMTLLCLLHALRSGRILHVEAVVHRLSRKAQDLLLLPTSLVGLFVSAVLTKATFALLSMNWMFNSVSLQPSQTPLWIPQAVMPLGFALLGLGYLERFLTAILHLTGHLPRDQEEMA